jgi:hypothetical protein
VLLAPAVVLGLFYAGLKDLAALPGRLSRGVEKTQQATADSYRAATRPGDSRWGWLRNLLSQLWSLRSLLSDHRTLLVRYGTLFRLVTPGFLLLVVGAAGVTLLLVPASLLALFVWLL